MGLISCLAQEVGGLHSLRLYSIDVTSWVTQTVKNQPGMRETQVHLSWEDLLEKEMATNSSTLAWKIPWTEPGKL